MATRHLILAAYLTLTYAHTPKTTEPMFHVKLGAAEIERVTTAESLLQALCRSKTKPSRSYCGKRNRRRLAAFGRIFDEAGDAYDVPPLLLASVAIHESHLNFRAVGAAGEVSMFQIMPRYKNGKLSRMGRTRYYQDSAYRSRCHKKIAGCQLLPAKLAACHLVNDKRICGTWLGALSRYNSGSCTAKESYGRKVMGIYEQLAYL